LSHAPSPFALFIFEIDLCLCLGWPGPQSSHLCFPNSWDDRHAISLTNFLPGPALNHDLCLWSSLDYRHEPPCLDFNLHF
jgi:hypothetical protein